MKGLPNFFFILSAVASLALLFQSRTRGLLLFLPFLAARLGLELYSTSLMERNIYNHWVINIISILAITFYMYMLSRFINNPGVKRIAGLLSLLFPAFFIFSGFYILPFTVLHTYEFSIGSFIVVCLCIYFFYELLSYPNDVQLLRHPPFWIATGLLFNYAGELPVSLFLNFIIKQNREVVRSIFFMLDFLNIMLSALLIIAFLCRLTLRKRSLSY